MSMKLDRTVKQSGTRFLLFPQPSYLESFRSPEVVYVNVPPQHIRHGPQDDRMFVVDATGKRPYADGQLPPYRGAANPPVKSKNGHFDHLQPDTREFSCATMYATVRRVLDIWEDYFGRRIEWHFRGYFDRLEMIPLIDWDNAQSGFGFLEFGFGRKTSGSMDYSRPYCQNFDVLAHELGHSIVFSQVGVPQSADSATADYGGFHESAGDLVAIIASLHFNSVVDHLLEKTRGDLFSSNELARVGELSESREIRVAFNDLRMSDVGDEPHDRSEPLTGAVFDILVEVFQKNLVKKGFITQQLADRSNHGPGRGISSDELKREFNAAYEGHKKEFKEALLQVRDDLGRLLARAWSAIDADYLSYYGLLAALLDGDREISDGAHQDTIRDCFAWREILPPAHSMLLHRYRLDDCGMRRATASAARPEVTEGATRLVRVAQVRGNARARR